MHGTFSAMSIIIDVQVVERGINISIEVERSDFEELNQEQTFGFRSDDSFGKRLLKKPSI